MADHCDICGVEVAESRSGKLVHVDAIPKGYEDHEVEIVVPAEELRARQLAASDLKGAAQDMLAHHITGHPEADCAFAQNLRRALR